MAQASEPKQPWHSQQPHQPQYSQRSRRKPASAPAAAQPIIVIVGQTASGKSALALRAARQFNGEIICADSRTVYKGMDIGTAKPSAQDCQLVPHHGLDLIEPDESFSAAAFQAYAREKVASIQSRGKLPIIVGGTGLYIDGYVYDFEFSGEADPKLRAALEALSLQDLQDRAHAIGIEEAQVNFKNYRHLSRAIERLAGRAEVPEANAANPTNQLNSQEGGVNSITKSQAIRKSKPRGVIMIGLQIEKEQLIERITWRVDKMFTDGLEDEVKNLIKRYGADAPGLLAPGYKAVKQYLDGSVSLDQAKELFIRSDRHLAKRQQTWFKRNPDIIWVQSEEEAMEFITNFTQV